MKAHHYDVKYILEFNRGLADDEILLIANEEDRGIITRDKDFGDLVYRDKMVHSGIILNRLSQLTTEQKIELILNVLSEYGEELLNAFTVIQPTKVRVKKIA